MFTQSVLINSTHLYTQSVLINSTHMFTQSVLINSTHLSTIIRTFHRAANVIILTKLHELSLYLSYIIKKFTSKLVSDVSLVCM